MKQIKQESYETLESAVARALSEARSSDEDVNFICTCDGMTRSLILQAKESSALSPAEVIARLKSEVKERPEPDAPIDGIPTPEARLPWHELHPRLKEVVLATLRQARERYALSMAGGAAQQVAVMSSMSNLLEQAGERGQVMAASMAAGASQSMNGAQAGKQAICAAYDVAIAALEQQ